MIIQLIGKLFYKSRHKSFYTLACILYVSFMSPLTAQPTDSMVENMSKISSKDAKTVDGIAHYINCLYAKPEDKAKAIYVWLALNVKYDMANRLTGIQYSHIDEIIERTLKTHKALCFGYAETFHAIANRLGLQTQVISGYTLQQGKLDDLPHSWCAVYLNNQWFMQDPTWGAGYVTNGKYHSKLNYKWFMLSPNEFISTHIPFDMMWQFSYFPISHSDVITSYTKRDSLKSKYFNYPDSIAKYNQLSKLKQLESSNNRIASQGIVNKHIKKHITQNKKQIDYLYLKDQTELFNNAVNLFNEGVSLFNEAINLKNKNDKRLVTQIEHKVNMSIKSMQTASEYLKKIPTSSQLANSVKDLKKNINTIVGDLQKMLNTK